MKAMKIPKLKIKKHMRIALSRRYRWQLALIVMLLVGTAVVFITNQHTRAATATVVPISDVSANWTPVPSGTSYTTLDEGTSPSTTDYVHTGTGVSATLVPISDVQTAWATGGASDGTCSGGGTTHHCDRLDEGTSPTTTDYVHTGTGSTSSITDEYGLTAAPTPGATSAVTLNVYAQSATNANGGTLDTLNINLKVNGTTQTASTCTPSFNSWGWCTANFSGSWSATDVANMTALISNTVNGSGSPSGREDDIQVADVYAAFSSNASVTDEYGLTNVPAATTASQMVLNVYAQSATNANGGTLDGLSINLKVNGSLQTASTCTPAYNTWGWCTATFNGSWTSADVANMHAVISNTINGTGSPEDDMLVADIYGTLTYNSAPAAPTLSAPSSGATGVGLSPVFTMSATDSDSDYLRYKLTIYQSNCSTVVATADETSSQTGWSGQNAQSNTAYNSGSTATYTYTSTLSPGTTYCWTAQAIDPGGSNTFGSAATTRSFTTNNTPAAPTLSTPGSGATSVALSPVFTLRTTDAESDYLRYKIILYQSDCSTVVATADQTSSQTGWSGQDQQASTAYTGSSTITSSTMATYTYTGTLSAATTYCWKAQAIDPGGSNTFGSFSSTQSFTTNSAPAAPTLLLPNSGATNQLTTNLVFNLRTSDADSDYLEYKIFLYQSDCSTLVATFDQTSSQTGWSGQDANGGNAYVGSTSQASSTTAVYTYTGVLTVSTTYCWQAQAIDPGGSNTFSSLSGTRVFTTNSGSTMSSINGGTNIRGGTRFGN
jgi:hypothetical protein